MTSGVAIKPPGATTVKFVHLPDRVLDLDQLDAQLMAAAAMFRALSNLPCGCLHNVPYAGGQVEQVVKTQCALCRSMAAWTLATAEKPAAAEVS